MGAVEVEQPEKSEEAEAELQHWSLAEQRHWSLEGRQACQSSEDPPACPSLGDQASSPSLEDRASSPQLVWEQGEAARRVAKAGKGIHAWHKLASCGAAYQPCQDTRKEKGRALSQST